MTPGHALDHLVLFVPADSATNLPKVPPFFEQNFTLTPGGFHADGATSNVLIVLADGCYLELISFVDVSKAPSHWWGPDASFTGWKDWCLTNDLTPEKNWEFLGGKGGSHAEPIKGGRKRADGVDVKWAVTFPKGEKGGQDVRGRIPFFCHDVTDRNVRVPLSQEKLMHACGALGVEQLTVIVKDESLLAETRKVYSSIAEQDVISEGDELHVQAGRVKDVGGLGLGCKIILRLPKDEDERKRIPGRGFVYGDVVLGAKATSTKGPGTQDRLDGGLENIGGVYVKYL